MARTKKKRISARGFVGFLFRDWLLRLLSLLLAGILWFFFGGEEMIDKSIVVPVEIINLPHNLVLSSPYKRDLEVTLRGPRPTIAELSERRLTRIINLADARPGSLVIENTPGVVEVPRGVTVQRMQPSSIILSLDRLERKSLPIEARTIGTVKKGYYLKSVQTSPKVLTITASQTALKHLEKLYTRPINLTGFSSSVNLQVPLELSSKLVDLIGETSVTVGVRVMPVAKNMTFKKVKVKTFVDGVEVEPKTESVDVEVAIPESFLKKGAQPLSLFSLVAEGKRGQRLLPVKLVPAKEVDLPLDLLSVTPPKIEVEVPADAGPREVGERGLFERIPFLRPEKRKKRVEIVP